MAYVIVLTTCPSRSVAEKIALALLEDRLAACVQIGPAIKSLYIWKKRVQKASEVQVWIKTRRALTPKVFTKISSLHPYEVPEIISIPIQKGLASYLKWMHSETR